ncbi:Oxoglutarate/iron-dependent dioxygenase [Macleaya cordata]|uniref:Oxoglutarate/iron-dependent dioxygenase n=1 Tax=Macleaya cordata TaxID=56857 RepID=A0A200PT04_MACCD|nr:Oxoglutarate/iron-dependent dioxygenase [Macleaya cordata]
MEFIESSGIPCLDFSKNPEDLVEGSEGWKNLCKKVREACEVYGCFQVVYDKVPVQLHEEMVMGLKDLFDLPVETKKKNSNSKVKYAYIPKLDFLPLYESSGFKVDPTNKLDQARTFTDLMWPNGNPAFCQTVDRMSKMMVELERIIRKMIFESFGVEKYYDSNLKDSEDVLRIMKYDAPPSNVDSAIGVMAHTDNTTIQGVIYQDIQGLEVLIPKEGDEWVQVAQRQATFIILIGEVFKGWSNGRVHAAKHRVIMRGEKARYAYGLYALPKDGVVVEVPKEFIDN